MTTYYIEGTNEAENYDVERKKIGTIVYENEKNVMGERRYRKIIGTEI